MVSRDPDCPSRTWYYRGKDAVDQFLQDMLALEEDLLLYMIEVKPMDLTQEEKDRHHRATVCYICHKPFTEQDWKVRDHDHTTGAYQGPAHNTRNLQKQRRTVIPVIFHLSKVLMYQFHYQYIEPKYAERAQLLFTHTDSLCYQVHPEDFYHDIKPDLDLFGITDYPHTTPSTAQWTRKFIGKFKDETAGHPIREFVGLRPKMYGYVLKKNGKEVEKETAVKFDM